MKKMSPLSRVAIALASLTLSATYFLPVWFIYLLAPQYPEGLTMYIWLDKITGQVEIINGLNHYIGMKHISADMFPEFGFLIYIMGFFILYGLAVAISGNRKFLFSYLMLLVLGGIAALADFYKWGYDYGHNLDPKAAIQVPGFSYQPPVVGHKELLNFDAYSYPDTGGWVVMGAAGVFFIVWFFEWRKARRVTVTPARAKAAVLASLLALVFTSCSSGPQPIAFGKDLCDECKMTIMDPRFGAEVVTKKGKAYKFDDARCLARFIKSGTVAESDMAHTLVLHYSEKDQFIDVKTARFVLSPALKSPMNGNAAAFNDNAAAEATAAQVAGKVTDWTTLFNSF